ADLHRVGAAGDFDHGDVAEVAGEAVRVDGGGGDDEFEVGAAGEQPGEVAEQEVDVEAAFVRFVDDEGVVAAQLLVVGEFGQQDAVGHQLDPGLLADLVGEADLVADEAAEWGGQFGGDPVGHGAGGQPAGSGVSGHAVAAAAGAQADRGWLGGLARAGLAGHDHDLVVADGGGDLVDPLADRQGRRKFDVHRHGLRQDRRAAAATPSGFAARGTGRVVRRVPGRRRGGRTGG